MKKRYTVHIALAVVVGLMLACNLPMLEAGAEEADSSVTESSGSSSPGGEQNQEDLTGDSSSQAGSEATDAGAVIEVPPDVYMMPGDGPNSPTALNIPLLVRNPVDSPLSGEPVTSGIPFPSGSGISDANSLQLLDQTGSPVPAAFTVLARWGAGVDEAAAELRWVLLDFQANLEPGEHAYYFLQEGGPGPAPDMPVKLVEEGGTVQISTGAADFSVDLNDGALSAPGLSAPLLGVVMDESGAKHTASQAALLTAETYGGMRAVVRLSGAFGESGMEHTTEYWFYAGSPVVRIFHTMENNTPCPVSPDDGQISCYYIGSEGSIAFQDVSLRMGVDWGDSPVNVRMGGEETTKVAAYEGGLDGQLVLYQDSSGTDYWDKYRTLTDWDGNTLDTQPRMQSYVAFRGYHLTMEAQELNSGNQAQGWMQLEGGDLTWSVGVRDFWKQFPKALRTSPDGMVEISLFPSEFGESGYLHSLRAGEHKTHEIRLAPAAHPDAAMTPLFAAAPPEWYVGSGEFGLTALPDWEKWEEHEQYIAYQLDTSPHNEGLEHLHDNLYAAITATDFYGIFDYGDWPIDYEGYGVSPINAKYDFDLGLWVQFARSGDMRWFHLAEAADRHFADVDVLHTLHEPRHWSDGIIFGHSYHDEEGFTNPHRNEGGASPDTAYGVPGMLLTYYLTGYQPTFDAALELADCIAYRAGNDFYLCDHMSGECSGEGWALHADGLYDSNSRPASNALVILTAAYRATQDERYLRPAEGIIAFADPSNQPYINGPTGQSGGEEAALKPWVMNMYLRALAYHLEMRVEYRLEDTYDSNADYLHFVDWLYEYAWIDLEPVDGVGPRAAYPYLWFFDDRQGDPNDEWSVGNNVPSINNWLLLGADVQAYAYHLSGDAVYLDRAAALFRTGMHDPFFPGDQSLYSETKQMINSVTYGNIFLHMDAEAAQ